jgi:CheY-like chemotaxis protein
LVVDDSRGVRRAIEASLEPLGFEVALAENGAKALAQLKASPYDLVFLDINMPVLDGPGLLRMMRTLGITTHTVLITSGADATTVASSIKFGAEEYVSKPFTPERIRQVAAKVMGLQLEKLPLCEPRVLLYFTEGALASQLRDALPEHVALDAVNMLSEAMELATATSYDLILVDAQLLEGAQLLRDDQPSAAVLAVSREADCPPCSFAPAGAIDGVVSSRLDGAVVHDFLYQNFLRPLCVAGGGAIKALGFRGDPAYLDAYFAQLGRVLKAKAGGGAAEMPDVAIDLRWVPADAQRLAALVGALHAHLDALGAAAAFTVTEKQRVLVEGRDEVAGALLLTGPVE